MAEEKEESGPKPHHDPHIGKSIDDILNAIYEHRLPDTQQKIREEREMHQSELYQSTKDHLLTVHSKGKTDKRGQPKVSGFRQIKDADEQEKKAQQALHELARYGLSQVFGKNDISGFFTEEGQEDLESHLERYTGVEYDKLVAAFQNSDNILKDFNDPNSEIGQIIGEYSKNLVSHNRNIKRLQKRLGKRPEHRKGAIEYANRLLKDAGLDYTLDEDTAGMQYAMQILDTHSRGLSKAQWNAFIEDNQQYFRKSADED